MQDETPVRAPAIDLLLRVAATSGEIVRSAMQIFGANFWCKFWIFLPKSITEKNHVFSDRGMHKINDVRDNTMIYNVVSVNDTAFR